METLHIYGSKYSKRYWMWEESRQARKNKAKHWYDRNIKFYIGDNIKLPSLVLHWGTALRFFFLLSVLSFIISMRTLGHLSKMGKRCSLFLGRKVGYIHSNCGHVFPNLLKCTMISFFLLFLCILPKELRFDI